MCIDSPRDLFLLIYASPACFRTFQNSQEKVLVTVLKRSFTNPNLVHVLAIAHASVPSFAAQEFSYSKVSLFMDNYLAGELLSFPRNPVLLSSLCRLHTTLSYFCDHFITKMRSKLGHTIQRSNGASIDGDDDLLDFVLSSTELMRLERAFLRYELYCVIFSASNVTGRRGFRGWDQFEMFLSRIEPFEVEEMCTVHQYLTFRVEECLEQAEDYLVESLQSLPRASSDSVEFAVNDESELAVSGTGHFSKSSTQNLGEWGAFSTTVRIEMPRYISCMMSYGLEFIYNFVRSDRTERLRLIWSHLTKKRESLPEALVLASGTNRRAVQPDEVEDDDPSHANLGFVLFHDTDQILHQRILHDGIRHFPLRELGYVFWDVTKFRNPQMLEKFQEADGLDSEEIDERFDLSIRASVEERLQAIRNPRKHIDDILSTGV